MAPKKGGTPQEELSPSILDTLFPIWNDGAIAGEKDSSGKHASTDIASANGTKWRTTMHDTQIGKRR